MSLVEIKNCNTCGIPLIRCERKAYELFFCQCSDCFGDKTLMEEIREVI